MMNNATTTTDNEILALARVTCEELDHSFAEWVDELRESQEVCAQEPCDGDDMSEFEGESLPDDDDGCEPREDNFRDDVDADADALAGAGYGTDEDYGYFGGDEW